MFLMELPPGGADDPMKYAQATIKDDLIIDLVEKPEQLVSTLVQTGVSVFPPTVFDVVQGIRDTTPLDQEIGMTCINQIYVEEGCLRHVILPPQSYVDCGTHEALAEAQRRILALRQEGTSIF